MPGDDPLNSAARYISAQGAPLSRVLRPVELDEAALKHRSRRSFLAAGIAAVAGWGAWHWVRTRPKIDEAPWPLRRAFEANERVGRALVSNGNLAPQQPFGEANKGPRVNGDIGLDSDVDLESYRLKLSGLATKDGTAEITLDQLRAMPKTELTMQLCCIEGWSIFVNWGGVRFSDFVKAFPPATRSGKPYDPNRPSELFDYISMTTPDNSYYVGLDVQSALHPQTLLAYEIDGRPLSTQHGAPLRLAIASKYGIKNIKRIGSIHFTANRPRDYWAEQGYDWFSGI